MHPPYHLRHNKAVERFLFIELLMRINTNKKLPVKIQEFKYHGFGGPFLEDFKLLHHYFSDLKMFCIERDIETFKRQKFNKPINNIKLSNKSFDDYFDQYKITGYDIFWLDFTDNKLSSFNTFQNVLLKLNDFSIVKITLNASSSVIDSNECKRKRKTAEFLKNYSDLLPGDIDEKKDFLSAYFPDLLVRMLRVSSEKILQPSGNRIFQPLTCFKYKDNQPMVTLTGILLQRDKRNDFVESNEQWKYFNTEWGKSRKINVPTLSLKERIFLDQLLPSETESIEPLRKKLEFELDDTLEQTNEQLSQYADFYKFYPYFSRVII